MTYIQTIQQTIGKPHLSIIGRSTDRDEIDISSQEENCCSNRQIANKSLQLKILHKEENEVGMRNY